MKETVVARQLSLEQAFLVRKIRRIRQAGNSISIITDVLEEIAVHEDDELKMEVLTSNSNLSLHAAIALLSEIVSEEATNLGVCLEKLN